MSWLIIDLLVDGEAEDITIVSSSTSPAQQVLVLFLLYPPFILDKSLNIWKKFYNNDDISISLMNRLTQMRKFGR